MNIICVLKRKHKPVEVVEKKSGLQMGLSPNWHYECARWHCRWWA